MKEATLKYLSIFCSLAGLAMLYFAAGYMEIKATPMESLSSADIGKGVKICGSIAEKHTKNGHIFMKLSNDSRSISAVIFNQTAASIRQAGTNPYTFPIGGSMCFLGNLAEYPKGSGTLEIIIRKVA